MTRTIVTVLVLGLLTTGAALAGGKGEAAAPKAAGPVTLIGLGANDPNGPQPEKLAYAITKKEFLEKNPDIKIEEEIINNSETLYTKVKTLAAANELPHFFRMRGDLLASIVKGGGVSPVNYVFDENPGYKDLFNPGVFDNWTREGKIYGIPLASSAHGFFYNKEILAQAGVTSWPKTWAEFVAMVKTLKANIKTEGFYPIGLGAKTKWPITGYFSTWVIAQNGVDWYESLKSGRGAKWTDPGVVTVLKTIEELKNLAAFNPDMNGTDVQQARALLYTRKVAMVREGNWLIGTLLAQAPDDLKSSILFGNFPELPGAKVTNYIAGGSGHGVGISHRDKPEIKQALGRYLTGVYNARFGLEMALRGDLTNMRVDAKAIEASNLPQLSKTVNEQIRTRTLIPVMDHILPSAITEAQSVGLQELLAGMTTPERVAAMLQLEWEKLDR